MHLRIRTTVILCLFVSGLCSSAVLAGTPEILEELKSRSADSYLSAGQTEGQGGAEDQENRKKALKESELRFQAIKEAATVLGVQSGVRYRYDRIKEQLEKISFQLDAIYDFSQYLEYDGRVLPPVIEKVKNAFQKKSDDYSVSSRFVYRIRQGAKIVTNPPNWRSYLFQTFEVIEDINPLLLPSTDAEKKVWEKAVEHGWGLGIKQADRVFDANLHKLERNIKGLLTYKHLAAQNQIRIPMGAESALGIQIRGKTMDVDQRIFRITEHAAFNTEDKWKPVGYINTRP